MASFRRSSRSSSLVARQEEESKRRDPGVGRGEQERGREDATSLPWLEAVEKQTHQDHDTRERERQRERLSRRDGHEAAQKTSTSEGNSRRTEDDVPLGRPHPKHLHRHAHLHPPPSSKPPSHPAPLSSQLRVLLLQRSDERVRLLHLLGLDRRGSGAGVKADREMDEEDVLICFRITKTYKKNKIERERAEDDKTETKRIGSNLTFLLSSSAPLLSLPSPPLPPRLQYLNLVAT